jgi:hypothetical protein
MKKEIINNVESLGYTIQATSQNSGKSRLYLVDSANRVAHRDFYSNNISVSNIREKLAGTLEFRDNTYLSDALNSIYATALAHSMVNDRIDSAKIEAMVAKLPEYLKQEYSDRIDKFGGKVKEEAKVEKAPEKQMFYLIHAKSLELTNGKPVNFTNEFVGTERDFNEYKATYGKNTTMKADIVTVETFAPEFREAHRNIEKILLAYKAGTGDKAKMLETLKSFDNEALLRLEKRLKDDGMNPKKFETDMKGSVTNKQKPKM